MRLPIIPLLILMAAWAYAPTNSLRGDPVKIDILLQGGAIIDGTGNEAYVGDVAIHGDKIVAVGKVDAADARQVIDCEGLVVCPGFIDLHNHSDGSIVAEATRDGRCYLTQGCTTLVTGNCGGGRADVGKYYDEIAANGVGVNVAHLLPHGELRSQVMGKVRRAPTDGELQEMERLAHEAMEQGAWGMSTGLIYVPSSYAKTDELIAISRVIGEHGGIYASHMRNESDHLLESIEELIAIAKGGDLPGHISHLKATQRQNWGKLRAAARVVEQAREAGLRITADQYPYTASSTSVMAMLIPNEERQGGERATAERLQDPAEQQRIRPMVAKQLEARGQLMLARYRKKPEWVGRMIREIAETEQRDPVDVAMEILLDGTAQGINFGMDEADVRFAMTLPWVATASDGSSKVDDGTRPHPRSYGTFSRKIGRYSIQENVAPLPLAIRSASGLPADILGLADRGYVREGLAADLVVFDPEEYEDRATYEQPFETSAGVRWVLVNGEVALADGASQDKLAGKPLRHKSKKRPPG